MNHYSPTSSASSSMRSARFWQRPAFGVLVVVALCVNAATGVLLAANPALQVSVTDTRTTAVANELLTYTVQVNNTTSTPLANVRIRTELSPDVTFVSASDGPTLPTPPNRVYEWDVASLSANGVLFRYLSVIVNTPLAQGTVLTTTTSVDHSGDPTVVKSVDVTTVQAPVVAFSPKSLTFDNQRVGQESVSQSLTLSNNGDQPLRIDSMSATNGAFKVKSTTCPNAGSLLQAGANCTIDVTFTPLTAGTTTADLQINDGAAGSPHSIPLAGTGTQPEVTLTPNTVLFSNQRVGTTSDPQQVTLRNSGTAPLSIATITASSLFAQTNDCPIGPGTLEPNTSCTIAITFTPATAIAASGAITITDDAPNGTHVVTLNGNGTQPGIDLAPTGLMFDPQAVGTQSPAKQVKLTNTGTAALTIGSIAASTSEFTQTNDCPTILAAGDDCTIAVIFQPTALGAHTGNVTIGNDAAGSSSISLEGTGLEATVQIAPTVVDFGSVQVGATSANATVTITNTGNTGLSFTAIAVTQGQSDFVLGSTDCPINNGSLASGASCAVALTFAPTVRGALNGTLTFTDSAPGGTQSVSLKGVGLQAILNVAPIPLAFGGQRINTTSNEQYVTLTNDGNQPTTIANIVITPNGEFAHTSMCASTLEAGASCTVGISFTPNAVGTRSATLAISDDASNGPHNVLLSGAGTDPKATLDASGLSFPAQQVNTTSTPQRVTLTNDGTGDLKLTDIKVDGNFAQTNTCPTLLGEGASCTIDVTFRPTAIDVRNGLLTITDDASNSPQTVALSGTGIQPILSLEPTSLDFGDQAVTTMAASRVITVTNTGSQPLTITSIATNSDFAQTNSCPSAPASLGIGASCAIEVSFTPTTVGTINGALTITSNAPSSPHTLTLMGNGLGATYRSIPAPGTVPMSSVLGASNSITIAISNGGNQPLSIAGPAETVNPPFRIVSDSAPSIQQDAADRVIVVECAPTSVGPFTQRLTFTTNDAASPTVVYALVCTGTLSPTAGYSSSPAPGTNWTIGAAQLGDSVAADLFISETGTAALSVGLQGGSAATAISGPNARDFVISEPTNFPLTLLDNGAAQRLVVRCEPSGAGTRTATLTLTTNDPSQPTVSYGLVCTGQSIAGRHLLHLPIITKAALVTPASQPDLVALLNVSASRVAAGAPVGISVTVTNQGTTAASEFWVDLYINPSAPPTGPNQPWNQRCGIEPCYGIAWYVTQQLAPGQSVILTSDQHSYYADNTIWPGSFAKGTSDVYVYVDSWNPTVADGAVAESNEANNRDELHNVVVTGGAPAPALLRHARELAPRP